MKEEKIRKRVRNKVQKLLSEGVFDDDEEEDEDDEEEHPQKVDKRKGIELDDEDDKMVLFDGFVEGLVDSLRSYDVSSLKTERLSDAIQSHSLKRMFQADTEDEYYNYKSRLQKSDDIANQVMNYIQNDEEEPEPEPVFVDYDNVGYDDQLAETGSKSQKKLMNMVYEYKKMKNKEDEEGLEEFFWGKPDRLKEKIKRIGENLSMGKLREYCGTGDHGLPDGVSKDEVMNEFRNKIRDKVREYFENNMSEESGQGILEDFE